MLKPTIDRIKVCKSGLVSALCLVLCCLLVSACAETTKKPVVEVVKPVARGDKPMLTPEEQNAWNAALALLQQGKVAAAEAAFEALLVRQPRLAGAYVNLGLLAEQVKDPEKALRHYQKAVEINPANEAALVQMALLNQARGKFREAEIALLKAEAVNSNSAVVQYNLGVLYELYLQDAGLAVKHYRRYVKLSSSDDKALVERWILLLERKS